jgi:hypothetical protein
MNMYWLKKGSRLVAFVALFLLAGTAASFAQNPQLPFNWKGDGTAWILGKDGVGEVAFKGKFRIDAEGKITGDFSDPENPDNKAVIERMYFTADAEGTRKVYLILTIGDDEKSLVLLSLRVLKDSFGYGEILIKELEKDGEIEKGLSLGDKAVQEIYEDYIPAGVEKALKKLRPIGVMKMSGGMSSE